MSFKQQVAQASLSTAQAILHSTCATACSQSNCVSETQAQHLTSMKSELPSRPRTLSRSALYGLMQLTRTITPELTRSLETSPTRLMFSSRSSALKPRLQFRPCLQPG